MARDPRALRHVENWSTVHGACACWRAWRGCHRGQRSTRFTLRCWPRLCFTDTTPGRRLRLRNVVATAFGSRGARPARGSPRGEPADGPRSTRALADFLAWLSSWPTRDTLYPTSMAEGLPHRHRARSAAATSKRCDRPVRTPWRATRALIAPWRTACGPQTPRALADLAWLSSRPTRETLHPTLLA